MDQYIVDLQTRIKPKLRQVAQPSKRRHRHEQEQPGFKELLIQWRSIYQGVSVTMLSLSRRIEAAEARPAAPTSPPRKPDDSVEFEGLGKRLNDLKIQSEEMQYIDSRIARAETEIEVLKSPEKKVEGLGKFEIMLGFIKRTHQAGKEVGDSYPLHSEAIEGLPEAGAKSQKEADEAERRGHPKTTTSLMPGYDTHTIRELLANLESEIAALKAAIDASPNTEIHTDEILKAIAGDSLERLEP
jgi:hypothetical protein